MTTRSFLLSAWEWKPGALVLCLGLLAAYGAVWRFKPARKSALFALGWTLLFLTLTSPLHALADDYLFSAHMLMHLLLLLVIPLLLVCSIPEARLWSAVANQGKGGATPLSAGAPSSMSNDVLPLPNSPTTLANLAAFMTYPMLTWAAGLGAMWVWHQPAIFDAAHENPRIHELQIISLLVAGCLFWWPVVGPQKERRLSPLPGIIYLFTACLGCTILGIGITFAPPGLFPSYNGMEDPFGIRPVIQSLGVTPAVDQQFGGLMMWVPPCLIYASGVMFQLARMYRGDASAAPVQTSATSAIDTHKTHDH